MLEELAAMEELAKCPFNCPNCSVTFDGADLFCSELCDEEAKHVRYVRARKSDGRAGDPEVKEAIRIQRVSILRGGYDRAARRLTERERQFVKDRDGGKCQICGGPGDEIDHKRGSSNDPTNLQLLCDACHNKKTVARFSVITKESHPEEWAKLQELKKRAAASEPTRLCDDELWDSIWRELRRKRRDVATGQCDLFG
jgi:5-methylcytosine-specific restriction endonuclease McrA